MLYERLTSSQPISMADVRSYLSIQPDDQSADTLLLEAVETVGDRIEHFLGTWLSERMMAVTVPACHPVRVMGSVHSFTATLIHPDGQQEAITDRVNLITTPNGSTFYTPRSDGYVRIEFLTKAYMSPTVRLALLQGIRNYYTDRTIDPVTDEVESILRQLVPENI